MGRFVYVIGKGGVVEQRFIKTGGSLAISSWSRGLAASDQVITGNLQKIGPGIPVMPMPAQPATTSRVPSGFPLWGEGRGDREGRPGFPAPGTRRVRA